MKRRGLTRDEVRRDCLRGLVDLLRGHPAGLRRWTVMRAMREQWQRAGHEIGLKFESEVECVFFGRCSGHPLRVKSGDPQIELFYRPPGRAGEVWAAYEKDTLARADRTVQDEAQHSNVSRSRIAPV